MKMKKVEIRKKDDEQEIHRQIAEEAEREQDEEEDKPAKASDTYNIMVFVVALLILAGVAAFVYFRFFVPKYVDPYTESYDYNNFEFKKSGGLWKTEVQLDNKLITVPLHYGPREIRWIEIYGSLNDTFNMGPIYITFDPTTEGNKSGVALAAGELSLNLAQGFERTLYAACAKNTTPECADRPIVDCSNADKAVIYLLESNETEVQFNQNCVVVRGRGDNLVRAVDRLVLFWYGVMNKDESIVIEADQN